MLLQFLLAWAFHASFSIPSSPGAFFPFNLFKCSISFFSRYHFWTHTLSFSEHWICIDNCVGSFVIATSQIAGKSTRPSGVIGFCMHDRARCNCSREKRALFELPDNVVRLEESALVDGQCQCHRNRLRNRYLVDHSCQNRRTKNNDIRSHVYYFVPLPRVAVLHQEE